GPQDAPVAEDRPPDFAQEDAPGVNRLRPLEELQVAEHVDDDVPDPDEAGDGHDHLLADGGPVEAQHRHPVCYGRDGHLLRDLAYAERRRPALSATIVA